MRSDRRSHDLCPWPPTICIAISEAGSVVTVVLWITLLAVTGAVDGDVIIITALIAAAAALAE